MIVYGRVEARELILTHTDALLCAALGLGFQRADAEELVQETFLVHLSAPERFEGRSSLKTWLFGILYNKAREKRRANAREEAADPVDERFASRFDLIGGWKSLPRGPEDEALSAELRSWLEDCASALPLPQRAALYLREVEGQSTEEICRELDVTPNNLGVLFFRARNRMRDCLEKKWGERA